MPIYEYLCQDCNRIYSFLAKLDEQRKPACPKCDRPELEKQISQFAFKRSPDSPRSSAPAADFDPADAGVPPSNLDDPRAEREMMRLMRDAEHIDENDPKQLGALMRKMSDVTGEPFDAEMEEAVRRLESGEDPDRIEEDLGGALDESEGMAGMPGMGMGPPTRDDGLYSF